MNTINANSHSISFDNLSNAMEEIQNQIRTAPTHLPHRVALAQILCAQGQWDRAQQQLHHLVKADQEYARFTQIYLQAISGELTRNAVLSQKTAPELSAIHPKWLETFSSALNQSQQLNHGDVNIEQKHALDDAPATGGEIDGTPFDWLTDGDSRLGPVVEAIIDGRYRWMATEQLASIRFYRPQTLFDLIWRQAIITENEGQEHSALIPARYPGSESAGDQLALSKATEWVAIDQETWHGKGQRMLNSELEEFPILAIGKITFRNNN